MPQKKSKVAATNSTADLLRMFKMQPNHHVVTRQDLAVDYDKSSPATATKIDGDDDNNDDVATTSRKIESAGIVPINNYYTWNSHRTNKSFHKYVFYRHFFYSLFFFFKVL